MIPLLPRLGRTGLYIVWALMPCLSACDPAPSGSGSPPVASSPIPHDGVGPRLGEDVTMQPRLVREPAREDVPKIVAFGDSLTAGAGIPAEESFPAQLQRRLDQNGYRYRVINAGVSGDTTAGGLRRVEWVLRSRPRLAILELGANDGLRGLPLDQIQHNLDQIIRRLHAAGVTIILAGMKLPLNYGNDYRAGFEAVYEKLAQAHRVTLMPFFLEGVGGNASLNQGDGLHPTREGYRVIVEHLWPVLKPLLDHPSGSSLDASTVNQ